MGKEQDLLQAAKTGDLMSTQKLLSKLKANRNSEYTRTSCFYSEIWPITKGGGGGSPWLQSRGHLRSSGGRVWTAVCSLCCC